MKKLVIGIIITLLIITGISFFVLQKIGGMMIDSMIESEFSITDGNPGPVASASPQSADNVGNSQQSGEASGDSKIDDKAGAGSSPASGTASQNHSQATTGTKELPSATGKPTQSPTATPKKETIPVDKLEEIKNRVTPADRMTAAVLVLERLNAEDINELKSLASGGLTGEEKEKAKEIAYSKFSPEEIEKIKSLYHKYMTP